MRQNAEFFGEQELSLVYIAKKLNEALEVEARLTECGYDYLVETDTYRGGFIFQTQRVGAFFYVAPEFESPVRDLIQSNGFRPYHPDR